MVSELLVEVRGRLQIITFNRPHKKNAISPETYRQLTAALSSGAADSDVSITILTGKGDYFSSGNEFSLENAPPGKSPAEASSDMLSTVKNFISTVIDYPKPLVAIVNGPAIGVATTILGLFDIVYALEGASKMLYFNYRMTAQEAKNLGFVAEILRPSEIPNLFAKLREWSELPLKSVIYTKELTRSHVRQYLHEANDRECERLIERFQSDDFTDAIIRFVMRKKTKSKL